MWHTASRSRHKTCSGRRWGSQVCLPACLLVGFRARGARWSVDGVCHTTCCACALRGGRRVAFRGQRARVRWRLHRPPPLHCRTRSCLSIINFFSAFVRTSTQFCPFFFPSLLRSLEHQSPLSSRQFSFFLEFFLFISRWFISSIIITRYGE